MFKSYFISDSACREHFSEFIKIAKFRSNLSLRGCLETRDVLFIFESFKVIYISSVPLKFNCATNENEEVIVCLEKCPSFFISISHCKDDYK